METVWYKDIPGFITEKTYMRFFPSPDMGFAEQLNSMMRLAVYFAAIMLIIKKDANILFVPIFVGIFTYLVYSVDEKNRRGDRTILEKMGIGEEFGTGRLCQKPTKDNPFMNVLMTDYGSNPGRPRACRFEGKVKEEVKKNFDHNLYRDVDDIFHKKASDRQFYTTASTTIPNDVGTFGQWLYGTPKTCKEGNGNGCYKNMYRSINM